MRISVSLAAAAAFAVGFAGQAAAQNPGCWDTNYGTNLSLTDDSLAIGLALNFPFDMPGGGQTSSIDVCSNGFVWLVSGSSTSADFTPSTSELLSLPARICPSWMDMNPSAGGAVYFNSGATSATVTWLDVPEYANSGNTNSVQLTLFQGGAFQISVRSHTVTGTRDLIVGCSPGNGAADPGESDLSGAPIATGGIPTVYELFTLGTDVRDLDGSALLFNPDGGGGYVIIPLGPCASVSSYGKGCPTEPQFYELFDGTSPNDLAGRSFLCVQAGGAWIVQPCANCFEPNYQGTNLGLTDDSLAVGVPLGFNFPLPGTGGTTTSAVDVCSNGFIWLVSNSSGSADFTESIAELLSQPTRLAVFWDDLNPGAAGAVYSRSFAQKTVITWENVPEFSNTGANTFQAQLFSNGNIILSYDAAMTALDGLVGYSAGNGAPPGGAFDLTTAPFSTGTGGSPTTHSATGLATIGGTVGLDIGNLPASSFAAVINLGFTPLAIELSVIQMPSCFLLVAPEASLPVTLSGSTGTTSFSIPNQQSLAGLHFYTQGVILAPGTTPLGAVSTNALDHTMGG